jgi:hypothetical protein
MHMKTGAMMTDPLITIRKPGPDSRQIPAQHFLFDLFRGGSCETGAMVFSCPASSVFSGSLPVMASGQ